MTRHVAVLMGGTSSEREVSLNSGKACADALEGEGFKVTRIDVGADVATVLSALRPDAAFNALHGPDGEDGTIQGLLEILKIPYTHSGVLASALAMDKERAKIVMRAAGVDVPGGRVVNRMEAASQHVLPPPYVVKPIAEGSSMGVIIVRDGRSHPPQILASDEWRFGEQVLAEPYIAGRELTCGVMGDKPLGVIEVKAATEWYDYDAKYAPGGSIHVLPAELKPNVYHRVQELALTAHRALGCRGVSRADLRYDDTPGGTGALVVLEVNTQPGMTQTSLVPDMAAHAGLSFGELVRWMVEDASLNR
ncbi:D-alanine--D-alanine ligase [Methylobacterium sp. NFXW15]|uniref:D-alanine--D-alanine ligase n=1 Tax=Methylobacterium sp. NFXW15 TaxID=2819512 RepID=UPI003CF2DE85